MKQPRAQTMSSFVTKCEKENIEMPQVSQSATISRRSRYHESRSLTFGCRCLGLFVP